MVGWGGGGTFNLVPGQALRIDHAKTDAVWFSLRGRRLHRAAEGQMVRMPGIHRPAWQGLRWEWLWVSQCPPGPPLEGVRKIYVFASTQHTV